MTPRPAARPRDHDPARPWYDGAARLLPARPGRWVDLGCGRGELLTRAADREASAGLALDLDPDNVRASCAEAARAGLVADLAHPLPFADESLDGASLVEVIEHVWPAEALVEELARVLRTGGWLVLTTPNVVHWTYRWRALTGHPPKQEGYHRRFFTRATLRALLEAHGFRIEARASFGKQALATNLRRLARHARARPPTSGHDDKVRYRVPAPLEPLLAQHFLWRLRRR